MPGKTRQHLAVLPRLILNLKSLVSTPNTSAMSVVYTIALLLLGLNLRSQAC